MTTHRKIDLDIGRKTRLVTNVRNRPHVLKFRGDVIAPINRVPVFPRNLKRVGRIAVASQNKNIQRLTISTEVYSQNMFTLFGSPTFGGTFELTLTATAKIGGILAVQGTSSGFTDPELDQMRVSFRTGTGWPTGSDLTLKFVGAARVQGPGGRGGSGEVTTGKSGETYYGGGGGGVGLTQQTGSPIGGGKKGTNRIRVFNSTYWGTAGGEELGTGGNGNSANAIVELGDGVIISTRGNSGAAAIYMEHDLTIDDATGDGEVWASGCGGNGANRVSGEDHGQPGKDPGVGNPANNQYVATAACAAIQKNGFTLTQIGLAQDIRGVVQDAIPASVHTVQVL